jgi:hypothetical protein
MLLQNQSVVYDTGACYIQTWNEFKRFETFTLTIYNEVFSQSSMSMLR